MAGPDGRPARPRIGLLGVMQELYDEMLPGITERQAAYARAIGSRARRRRRRRGGAAGPQPRRRRAHGAQLRGRGLDGLLVVMLTYGPAMRVARALADSRLPVCLANVQPEPEVTAAWDMADLTYNQGIHGAQDTANAMVRAGRPVPRRDRGLAGAGVRPRGRRVGARGRRGLALARPARGRLRLRDERDGRHPRRRPHAAAHARPAGRRDRARRAAPRRRRGRRGRGAAADRRRERALRGRPAAERGRARAARAHAARARAAC